MNTKPTLTDSIRWRFALLHLFGAVLIAGAGDVWAQGEIFVSGNNEITVYSRTANGNVAPVRTIAGALTGFNGVTNVAPDTVHSELVMSNCNPGSVLVFPFAANGNVAPSRKISGAATGLTCTGDVAVDTVNDEILVLDEINNTISAFARTANGNVAPLRVLQLAGTVTNPDFFALDTVNNELVVPSNGSNVIAIYSRTASGAAATIRSISGVTTGLNMPLGVVVDTANSELVVGNSGTPSILVFSRTASGNTAPLRTISGGSTGLIQPTGLALDDVNNELTVANNFLPNPSITVYSRTANGDVAPVRTIVGAATGLVNPIGIGVTPGVPVLTGAVSRRVHGAAGTFDLPLSLVATNPTTEPRSGPAQTIVMTFDSPITAATATITEGTATAEAPTFSGNSVIVGLTGVTNKQYVTLSLTGVASSDGGSGGAGSVRVGFLLADVNQNRVVTVSDILLVNQQITHVVTPANFLKDVNANGFLTVSDKLIINNNVTKALLPP